MIRPGQINFVTGEGSQTIFAHLKRTAQTLLTPDAAKRRQWLLKACL
jgi:hypothetical protein